MSKSANTPGMVRREFIRRVCLTGGVMAAVPAVPGVFAAPARPDEPEESSARGYRETRHIRKYYETARG